MWLRYPFFGGCEYYLTKMVVTGKYPVTESSCKEWRSNVILDTVFETAEAAMKASEEAMYGRND